MLRIQMAVLILRSVVKTRDEKAEHKHIFDALHHLRLALQAAGGLALAVPDQATKLPPARKPTESQKVRKI